jgi:DNA-binding YbaB/EbfC family protein
MSDQQNSGGMPDLGEVLQTAQRMQQELQRVQQELADQIVEGSAGGGMVVARVNGRSQLVSISLERDVVDPDDIDMLQDLVVAAVNQALTKASELAQQQMSKITSGLPFQLPEGLF